MRTVTLRPNLDSLEEKNWTGVNEKRKMKKKHSVVINLDSDDVAALLNPIFKRKGWLKDIPNYVEPKPLGEQECFYEYHWEEDIKELTLLKGEKK
jgi:hypothetical protein